MGTPFELFSPTHLATLAVIVVLAVVTSRAAARARSPWLGWSLALALLLQEAVKLHYFIVEQGQPWQQSLPLDLCRINELLCVVILLGRSHAVFQVAYYWSIAGSVTAMLTPDLALGFPSRAFLLFFVGHGLVVLAVLYAIFGFGFRLYPRSLAVALGVTAAYAAIIAPLNLLLDANYLFLRAKPEAASVLDLFGDWPYYLPGLFVVAVVACLIAYLPFPLARRLARRRRVPHGG
jgi:hypothetical integral membrane protein (TIGR02206 family)